MHQRGQRRLRMPSDLDLQRGGAVRTQALRQPVGDGGGLSFFRRFAVVVVRAFALRRALAQLFQRAQRLGLGLAQQPAMDHGLPVAVDGDDGTGCGFHARAVALQAVFQRLQLLAQGFAFFLQGFGLVLVVGVHRRIYGFAYGLHLLLQPLDARVLPRNHGRL